ncbi:CHAT domain-containing protein [Paracoccus sp. T5]|uniref:CHAT domain-containing protein n=1 Tax=Paracoccus sp. T5 TaxID=3402161 RepID=UPI003ADC563B
MLARLWQLLTDRLRRRVGFGPVRRSDRPAALVIRGQADGGDLDDALDREVNDVGRALKHMDYDVLVVKDGTKEAFNSVLSTDFRSRLVVLHYAGHATDEGFVIQDGRGGNWLLKASEFARLFGGAASLRLIFLNGCWAFSQLKTYQNELAAVRGSIDCCMIGSRNEIGNELAADFAAAVYDSLADNATLADATENVAKFVISRDYSEDAAATVKVILNNQEDFRLSDGWPSIFTDLYDNGRNISFTPLLVYVVVLAAIGVTSAYLAHSPLSSPAFQAAFSIAPDPKIEAFVETHGDSGSLRNRLGYLQEAGEPPDALIHFGKTCTAGPPPGAIEVENLRARREIGTALDFNEHYGWMVEGGRVLLLAVLLLAVVGVAQQTKFPRRVPLLSKGEFAAFIRYPIGAAFLAIGLLGSAYIIQYHVVTGPAKLATFDPGNDSNKSWQERRWALVHCIPKAWQEAGWKDGSFFFNVIKEHEPGRGRVWSSFVETPEEDGGNGRIYFRMYQLPYLAYLPYSLTTFVGLLLPSLYIMFLTGFQSFKWCRMAAAGVGVQLRDWVRNRERIQALARQLERRSNEATRIFAVGGFAFCMAAIYEAYLGKNTIAMMARTSTVVAIVLVIFGGGLLAMLLAGLAQLKQAVRDDVEDTDLEFSQQLGSFMSVAIHPVQWLVVATTGAVVFRLIQLLFR